jgi:hypothetical protein
MDHISIDCCNGIETPFPRTHLTVSERAAIAVENWQQLCARFFTKISEAAAMTEDVDFLAKLVHCPSKPGELPRTMFAEDQLLNMASHKAYPFGRIVLIRQMMKAWPPKSDDYTW